MTLTIRLRIKMVNKWHGTGFKKDCGFRNKLEVCGFKPEDCNKEKCDFFIIPYELKPIKKQMDKEFVKIRDLEKQIKDMKAKKQHKEDEYKKHYQKLKLQVSDLKLGYIYLCKAVDNLSGGMLGQMSNLTMRMPKLGSKVKKFLEDKNIDLE